MKNRIVGAVLLLLVGLGGLVPAAAADTYRGSGINIRSGSSTSYPSLGQGQPSHSVLRYSYFNSNYAAGCGTASTWWTFHKNLSTGVTGFSSYACLR